MAEQRSARRSGPSPWWLGLAPFGAVGALVAAFCAGVTCLGGPCWSTGLRYGLWTYQCPASDLRMSVVVSAYGLVRGTDDGWVELVPVARWLDDDGRNASERSGNPSRGFDWELSLRDAAGNPVPGFEIVDVDRGSGSVRTQVKVPVVPDGDYVLRATLAAPYGEATVDAPLPLYSPALVHVMTDRPLYRPGQTVLFRSAMLRRTDESPLDGRPGRWTVVDPQGVTVLDERGAAGDWGVAASSFPLDADAPNGTWRVAWQSGADRDEVAFDVRPFVLPRFSVEVRPSAPWAGIGEELVFEGTAKYSSGAPVASAPVVVTLSVAEGRWPLPTAWTEPQRAVTGPDGRFRVALGPVPADLMDRDRVVVSAEVVEAAGESARGGGSVVLSPAPIHVAALTELGDGLVEGFNNRTYLRVTTPDGRPLPEVDVLVRRPYDPTDPGKPAHTDVDGVAVVQLDPGPPVTVVSPAPPVRPAPRQSRGARAVRATDATGATFGLEDQRVLDDALADLTACGAAANGAHTVEVAARLGFGGTPTAVVTGGDPVSRCVADRVRRMRFALGSVRTVQLAFEIPDADAPSLQVSGLLGDNRVTLALEQVASEARACVARDGRSGPLFDVHWRTVPGSAAIQVELDPRDAPGASDACVRAALGSGRLPTEATAEALGVTRVSLVQPQSGAAPPPQPTTSVAYELAVEVQGAAPRAGRVVLPVGVIPAMRLRAQPPLAHPGDEVAVELVRGPSFGGTFPEELSLYAGSSEVGRVKVVDKVATFRVPEGADGFLHADFAGARAVVFVRPVDPLTVTVSPDRATYAPGDSASLTVTARRGEAPAQAGVSLVGVDSMLGQLAPLLGPDDFGRVVVRAKADAPAFGAFDPKALALGQIRGENAARAAVARVTQLPMDPAGDLSASANAASTFDPRAALVENFYRVLVRAADDLAAWEATAPSSEHLDAARMVRVWNGALRAVEDQGHPVEDGYGRRLTLDVVPLDLLAQVDPRKLVSDATRMPEDAEDFVQYVQREVR
jgi:hypothetical protein